ncbi:MAG TPA: histidine kinase [Streptosporangiaceae bacterium]|nr:histidine kinase [Streptosporangiaceae bacterium]
MIRPEPAQPGPGASPTARQYAVDAVIAAVVITLQLLGSHAATGWHEHAAAPGVAAYLVLAAGGGSLLARRRYPVAVLAITLASALTAAELGASVVWLALVVAFFTAVLARKRAAAIAALIIGYLGAIWPPWRISQRGHSSVTMALGLAACLIFLLLVAELIRNRNQRAADAQRRRDEELRRRASEERMRMARDLHDVVAHNIAVINVQANTALHLMDRQPERARTALSNINDVSKQALVELRSVLGVLRGVDGAAPRAPAPGLAQLGDLVDHATAAGLNVRVEEDGQPGPLPADVDLSAYRIIQEALTNTARHSRGTQATVRLGYADHGLEVAVDDDGPPSGSSHGGSGNGIAGMTERATALGGTLRAGPRPGGGFQVRAWLPLAEDRLPEDRLPEDRP